MSPHHCTHTRIAARSVACVGAALALDSGLAPGLVVVDSNRPAIRAGFAPSLRKQSGVAH